MALNIANEVAALERLTPRELRERYARLFGEPARSGNKQWLVKRIAWRLQASAEGDLSERARRRALELANDADLRIKTPRAPRPGAGAPERMKTARAALTPGNRLPLPGSVLAREYKGRTVVVTVQADGFVYDGRRYPSLTAVAKAVTGTHWNGYHFFGLKKNGRAK